MLLDCQAFVGEEANMLLVSRWEDDDVEDGAVAAMVDELLATVAPAAADRSADLRPLVGAVGRALSAAGHGGRHWQGKGQENVPIYNAEEIALPDDDDEDGLIVGDEPDSSERRPGHDDGRPGAGSAVDHVHITNGVAECHLHASEAEGLHCDPRQMASCMAEPHSIDNGDQRIKHFNSTSASKKARWLKAAERNKARKKVKLTDVEQSVAVPC